MARGLSRIRIHGVSSKDWLERSAFIASFGLGAFGIITMKAFGVSPYAVALFSAAMIVGYMLVAMLSGRIQVEPDMIGDNCYYLGFLFTLTSLSYTLSELASSDPELRSQVILKVISGFGVALSSTIVGVFLRVVLMHVRPDIVARDREMHIELHESVRELRRQMASSILAVKQFTVESLQHAQERDARIEASLEKAAGDLGKQGGRAFEDLLAEIKAGNQKAGEALTAEFSTKIAAASEQAIEQMAGALTRVGTTAGGIAETYQRETDALAGRFRSIEDGLTGLTSKLGALDGEVARMTGAIGTEDIGKAVESLQQAIAQSAEKIEDTTRQLEHHGLESNAAIEKSSQEFCRALDASTQTLRAALEDITAATQRRRGFWPFRSGGA